MTSTEERIALLSSPDTYIKHLGGEVFPKEEYHAEVLASLPLVHTVPGLRLQVIAAAAGAVAASPAVNTGKALLQWLNKDLLTFHDKDVRLPEGLERFKTVRLRLSGVTPEDEEASPLREVFYPNNMEQWLEAVEAVSPFVDGKNATLPAYQDDEVPILTLVCLLEEKEKVCTDAPEDHRLFCECLKAYLFDRFPETAEYRERVKLACRHAVNNHLKKTNFWAVFKLVGVLRDHGWHKEADDVVATMNGTLVSTEEKKKQGVEMERRGEMINRHTEKDLLNFADPSAYVFNTETETWTHTPKDGEDALQALKSGGRAAEAVKYGLISAAFDYAAATPKRQEWFWLWLGDTFLNSGAALRWGSLEAEAVPYGLHGHLDNALVVRDVLKGKVISEEATQVVFPRRGLRVGPVESAVGAYLSAIEQRGWDTREDEVFRRYLEVYLGEIAGLKDAGSELSETAVEQMVRMIEDSSNWKGREVIRVRLLVSDCHYNEMVNDGRNAFAGGVLARAAIVGHNNGLGEEVSATVSRLWRNALNDRSGKAETLLSAFAGDRVRHSSWDQLGHRVRVAKCLLQEWVSTAVEAGVPSAETVGQKWLSVLEHETEHKHWKGSVMAGKGDITPVVNKILSALSGMSADREIGMGVEIMERLLEKISWLQDSDEPKPVALWSAWLNEKAVFDNVVRQGGFEEHWSDGIGCSY